MNFYKRFVGDIQAKTGHLSLAEFGAYDRLLDHCYSTERPLPTDVDAVCRIARAMSREERKAVESVLRQFFKLTDDGFIQPRVLEMLADAQPKIEANRENGKKGGRPRLKPKETEEKPNGFPEETKSEPNENLSQSQILSSLRSESGVRASRLPPDWVLPDLWREWARAARPDLDINLVAEKFRDFWVAKPGKDGRKTDWLATWRNWVRGESAPRPMSASNSHRNEHKHSAAAKAIFDGVFDD